MIFVLTFSIIIGLTTFGLSFFINKNLIISIGMGAFFTFFFGILGWTMKKSKKEQKRKIIFSFIGLGLGIVFNFFLLNFWDQHNIFFYPIIKDYDFLTFIFFILTGIVLGYIYGSLLPNNTIPSEYQKEEPTGSEKILDSSVIIDGRILKIAKTNFIEGPFIIPNFVLREIQLISDSADPIKRNRGRRGLDMLNELQQLNNIKVKISYIDYPDIRDVDSKLIQLARDIRGKLITNDFNLEKVAEVQGVQVLNLNALTEALRPIVLPGEELKIQVVKEGKDENQGVGYLDDGTMVVIEDGRELIGKLIKVNVTSIIQTAAGKMIFTKAIGPVEEDIQYTNDKDAKNKQVQTKDKFLIKKNKK